MTRIIPDKDLEKYIKATGDEKGDIDMPTLSMFYGVIIYMYYC